VQIRAILHLHLKTFVRRETEVYTGDYRVGNTAAETQTRSDTPFWEATSSDVFTDGSSTSSFAVVAVSVFESQVTLSEIINKQKKLNVNWFEKEVDMIAEHQRLHFVYLLQTAQSTFCL